MSGVIDYHSYSLSLSEWLRYGAVGLLADGCITYLFFRAIPAFVLMLPLAWAVPRLMQGKLCERRKQELSRQFRDGATTLASLLSSGYSVENAFAYSVDEMVTIYGEDAMITREFRRISNHIALNRTVEEGILDLAKRSGSNEIEQFAEVFLAAKRSSGDLNRVLKDTADLLARKISLREEIRTMVAAKQLEQNIMNLMPAGILLYINLTNPGYTDALYAGAAGHILMGIFLMIYGLAVWWGRRILNISIE